MLKSVINEYGFVWLTNRILYSFKLKILKVVPIVENIFEKKVSIKRVDLFSPNSDVIEHFLCDLSREDKYEILRVADNITKGILPAFSSVELPYGNPINWHINPLTQYEESGEKKWYLIPDFDKQRGDIKAIWEASRFSHLFYLSRAYMITKDKKYYNEFSEQIESWIRENKYSFGVNYKCGQEAAFRMMNILINYGLFKNYGLITESDTKNVFGIVHDSYKKIQSNFFYARKCIRNNHAISEAVGLLIGAYCSNKQKQIKKSFSLLDQILKEQFLEDGGYIQYSFNYQRLVLQLIEVILLIETRTQYSLSDESRNRIRKSILQMYQIQDSSGDVPNYGSNDGALIFPVTVCDFRDFRPTLNSLHMMLNGKRLFKKGKYDEEVLWFSEIDPLRTNFANIERKSKAYRNSGLFTFRHEFGHMMIVMNKFETRPAQMDQLHIDLWHKGINILCDSGTYSYATGLGKELALTRAHNTLKIKSTEQMNKRGAFLIYDWTESMVEKYDESNFIGKVISKNGYTHRRKIIFEADHFYINDFAFGDIVAGEIVLHTPCEVKKVENSIVLKYEDNEIAKLSSSAKLMLDTSHRSLYYLRKEGVNRICIQMTENKGYLEADFRISLCS